MAKPGTTCSTRGVRGVLLTVLVLVLGLFAAGRSGVGADVVEDTVLAAAHRMRLSGVSDTQLAGAVRSGLWNSNRTAVALSLPRPKASLILVFLRQSDGSFLGTDASGVEGGNFGKLGTHGREGYERFETTPVRWLPRDDGLFQVIMRTRAWKGGRRYTVSEPLVIRPDGTVLYR